ncbi:hypothetical protein [Prevotella bivia]|uniref:Uncharacterized protein n=1 Tax=Prevotella bivia DSM 20514 TaxID=868129 RepID=I4ZAC6_9BACT|nr:hypothetical protein [Prevotella bivia]EIM33168.1 hypothetical protein PrebiDRAFT_1463 [Prevotella bivia DSM 20514]
MVKKKKYVNPSVGVYKVDMSEGMMLRGSDIEGSVNMPTDAGELGATTTTNASTTRAVTPFFEMDTYTTSESGK